MLIYDFICVLIYEFNCEFVKRLHQITEALIGIVPSKKRKGKGKGKVKRKWERERVKGFVNVEKKITCQLMRLR